MSFFKKLFKGVKKYLKFTSGLTFHDKVTKKLTKKALKKVGGKKAVKFYDDLGNLAGNVVGGTVDSLTGNLGVGKLVAQESGYGGGGGGSPPPIPTESISPDDPGDLKAGSPVVVLALVAAGATAVYFLSKRR